MNDEFIRDAQRESKMRRTLGQHEQAALRQLWAEGLDSGPGQLGTMDAIKREARRRVDAASPSD